MFELIRDFENVIKDPSNHFNECIQNEINQNCIFLGLTGHDMVKKNDTVIIFDTVTIWL